MTRAQLESQPPNLIVALTIFGEARGEPVDGQIAVACVIRNRVRDLRWPDDYSGVCLQKKQFSCWNPNDPTYPEIVKAAERTLISGMSPILKQCEWIASGVIRGAVLDITDRANHYHARTIKTPRWAKGMVMTGAKGQHVFYRG